MNISKKAVALLSGGLDSTLAVKLMIDQGIDLTAVHFTSVFCNCSPKTAGCKMHARKVAEEFSVPIHVIHKGIGLYQDGGETAAWPRQRNERLYRLPHLHAAQG
jgi:adenylyl- and sulfurtransferase ThiI